MAVDDLETQCSSTPAGVHYEAVEFNKFIADQVLIQLKKLLPQAQGFNASDACSDTMNQKHMHTPIDSNCVISESQSFSRPRAHYSIFMPSDDKISVVSHEVEDEISMGGSAIFKENNMDSHSQSQPSHDQEFSLFSEGAPGSTDPIKWNNFLHKLTAKLKINCSEETEVDSVRTSYLPSRLNPGNSDKATHLKVPLEGTTIEVFKNVEKEAMSGRLKNRSVRLRDDKAFMVSKKDFTEFCSPPRLDDNIEEESEDDRVEACSALVACFKSMADMTSRIIAHYVDFSSKATSAKLLNLPLNGAQLFGGKYFDTLHSSAENIRDAKETQNVYRSSFVPGGQKFDEGYRKRKYQETSNVTYVKPAKIQDMISRLLMTVLALTLRLIFVPCQQNKEEKDLFYGKIPPRKISRNKQLFVCGKSPGRSSVVTLPQSVGSNNSRQVSTSDREERFDFRFCDSSDRCVTVGMGSSYKQLSDSRYLATSVQSETHQLARTQSCAVSTANISDKSTIQKCASESRQCNCRQLSEQTGRDPISRALLLGMGSFEMVHKSQCQNTSSSYTGEEEYYSRCPVKGENDHSFDRMGVKYDNSEFVVPSGTPVIDLFATSMNKKLPVFCSPWPEETAVLVDALSMKWTGIFAYAFPPPIILNRVLQKIQKEDCVILLIAPMWPRQS
ncbi:unnamed protein product [Mytilus coruscus]|uniref:Uncharacterized protein n=1 Tax=Mytilus coruscus TaxID=42192 RepID=A0A6J8ER45_MYTCO|nr:unnamed protein product [Mytilus coruscus]